MKNLISQITSENAMLLFTNEQIKPLDRTGQVSSDQPFQPGELYVTKYMRTPALVTIIERTANNVRTWHGTESVEEFNQRVLFQLGRRTKWFGFWMPWARVDFRRVIRHDLADSIGTDEAFWKGRSAIDAKAEAEKTMSMLPP